MQYFGQSFLVLRGVSLCGLDDVLWFIDRFLSMSRCEDLVVFMQIVDELGSESSFLGFLFYYAFLVDFVFQVPQ